MAALNFNAAEVEPSAPIEAIPAGDYLACMTASEMKPTSKGDGAYLKCEFTVLEGGYKGRKIFTNLNLQNANPIAVEIAYRTLSAICHATGVIQVTDSSQLHNIPMELKVSVRPAQVAATSSDGKNHDASNEIKGFKAVQAKTVAPVTPPVQSAPVAPVAIQPPTQPAWAAAPVQSAPVAPVAIQPQPAPIAVPVAAAVPPWAVKQ